MLLNKIDFVLYYIKLVLLVNICILLFVYLFSVIHNKYLYIGLIYFILVLVYCKLYNLFSVFLFVLAFSFVERNLS